MPFGTILLKPLSFHIETNMLRRIKLNNYVIVLSFHFYIWKLEGIMQIQLYYTIGMSWQWRLPNVHLKQSTGKWLFFISINIGNLPDINIVGKVRFVFVFFIWTSSIIVNYMEIRNNNLQTITYIIIPIQIVGYLILGFPFRRVATRTQKPSCVHIENFDKNENMVNLGHQVE